MPADFGASSYASRLTPRTEKGGGLGLPEHAEEEEITASKILKLADLIRTSKKCVVLTGAGISTSAGVSDFRGPNGVWTAEKKGIPPPASRSFETVQPTLTHMALLGLVQAKMVDLVISQNVDGLHLRSGLPRENLAELHGNLFIESCEICGWEYLRDFDVGGISFSKTGRECERPGCGGALRNNLLDWEDALPEQEFQAAEDALRSSDLCICMGTSLRIRPASELPLITVKNGGKLVLCNLQKTPKDRHACLKVHAPIDEVMRGVMAVLGVRIPKFTRSMSLKLSCKLERRSGSAGPNDSSNKAVHKTDDCQEDVKVKEEGTGRDTDEERAVKEKEGGESSSPVIAHGQFSSSEMEEEECWMLSLSNQLGADCPLPLLEAVEYSVNDVVLASSRDSFPLQTSIPKARIPEFPPSCLAVSFALKETCNPNPSVVHVKPEQWAKVTENFDKEAIKLEAFWSVDFDLPVADIDFDASDNTALVESLNESAKRYEEKRAEANKRKFESQESQKSPASRLKLCATCQRWKKAPSELQDDEAWFCRRRCVPISFPTGSSVAVGYSRIQL